MDKNAMLVLGMVKLENKSGQNQIMEVAGFDVFGFFLPFVRLITAGMWLKAILCCVTFLFLPIWCWYIGFNFRRMRFEKLLAEGWSIAKDEVSDVKLAS